MRRLRTRKGLSPLVATVVLISATILGGMLIYNYFQDSVGRMKGLSEGIIVDASAVQLSSTTSLAHVELLNNYDTQVTIIAVKGITQNGSSVNLTTQEPLPIDVAPGDKASINALIINPDIVAVSIVYRTIDGKTLTTQPEPIR